MYIDTWSQFVNKEHLIDEAVKLAVAFFEDDKIRNVDEVSKCRLPVDVRGSKPSVLQLSTAAMSQTAPRLHFLKTL